MANETIPGFEDIQKNSASAQYDVAVLGEDLYLYISEAITGDVTVSFASFVGTDLSKWTDYLLSEAIPSNADAGSIPNGAQSRIAWKVAVYDSKNNAWITKMPKLNRLLFIKIYKGKISNPEDGTHESEALHVLRELKLPGFYVTDNARLRMIMLHEFGTAKAGTNGLEINELELDEDKLYSVIDNLTVQQKQLLANYDVSGFNNHRLISFITIQPENFAQSRRMHLDNCAGMLSYLSNATFTLFHCSGKGMPVELVCHTEYHFIGFINTSTKNWLKYSVQNKQNPDEWLSRSNKTPPVFKMAGVSFGERGDLVWSHFFDSKGNATMKGNFFHGMVNTLGCWSLFRNYHWPQSKKDVFDALYMKMRRGGTKGSVFVDTLDKHGYSQRETRLDTASKPGTTVIYCSSLKKWLDWDWNHAYSWFCHDIMGVKYFSTSFLDSQCAHNHNLAQHAFEDTLNVAEGAADFDPKKKKTIIWHRSREFAQTYGDPNPDDPSNPFIYHSLLDRRLYGTKGKPQAYTPTDSLWVENQLGFKTSEGFMTAFTIPKSKLNTHTWADAYFFKDDSITKIAEIPDYYAVKQPEPIP